MCPFFQLLHKIQRVVGCSKWIFTFAGGKIYNSFPSIIGNTDNLVHHRIKLSIQLCYKFRNRRFIPRARDFWGKSDISWLPCKKSNFKISLFFNQLHFQKRFYWKLHIVFSLMVHVCCRCPQMHFRTEF